LEEDDEISIGDYVFKCVETPGHTKGHMCLYEPKMKIFIAGDHILSDITPTIQLWSDEWNPLKEYLASLDKVHQLDIELVLPGHRSILETGSKNAFQVASEMKWDIEYDAFDLFPVTQKWFATGEAIAHLKYLEESRIIRREMRGEKVVFLLNLNQ
jgi:glyoxylase-like metal-dependent hydrolase (beta-lactamase superfamily II)